MPESNSYSREPSKLTEQSSSAIGSAALIGSEAGSAQNSGENLVPDLGWKMDENSRLVSDAAHLITTLPTEFFRLDEQGRIYTPAFALDLLEPGSYIIQDNGGTGTVVIIESEKGKFVTAESNRSDHANFQQASTTEVRNLPASFGGFSLAEGFALQMSGPDNPEKPGSKLLEKFGYFFDPSRTRKIVPTPATLQIMVDKNAAPIVLIEAATAGGTIPLTDYIGAFASGKYPVGTGDLGIYAHDVRSNDHIAGVLAAGPAILDHLKPLAQGAIDKGREIEIAEFYDIFTADVTTIINTPSRKDIDYADDVEMLAADNLVKLCERVRRAGELINTPVDTGNLLEMFKQRFSELHQTYNLGTEFAGFVAKLANKQMPEREPLPPMESHTSSLG